MKWINRLNMLKKLRLYAELDLNKEETPIVLDNEADPVEIEPLDENEDEPEVA